MEIKPLVGVDNILLGSTRDDVKKLLGEPSEICKDTHEDGCQEEDWEYHELGLALTFLSVDDYLLGAITVINEKALFMGHRMIGMIEEDFLEALEDCEPGEILVDDEVEFEEVDAKDFIWDAKNISFWMVDGVIDHICVMPEYDEAEENPIWPKAGE